MEAMAKCFTTARKGMQLYDERDDQVVTVNVNNIASAAKDPDTLKKKLTTGKFELKEVGDDYVVQLI